MIAQENKTYAQIQDGKCHWIFTKAQLPEWNENHIQTVDITGQTVEEGYLYENGVFTAPPPPEPPVEEPPVV